MKKRYAIVLAAVLAVLLIGLTLAKFVHSFESSQIQMTAENFYFTADLLGDDTMIEGEDGTYAFPAEQSGEWYLYGSGKHEISIEVRNYSDKLRVTEDKINYTAWIETSEDYSGTPSLSVGEDSDGNSEGESEGKLDRALDGGQDAEMKADILTLTIPEDDETDSGEESEISVVLRSSSPYEKTIRLKFILKKSEQKITYRVNDYVGSPYAELVIMSDGEMSEDDEKITLVWPKGLSIDNTNALTFSVNDGSASGMEIKAEGSSYRMELSRALKAGESTSIYFFKADTSACYDTDGVKTVQDYTIAISDSQ
jgi:hypothetical protein